MNAVPPLAWTDLELLALVASHGTLGAAARALKVDATTASRRLTRLEKRAGGALFDRVDGRLVPTPLLQGAMPALASMGEAASLSLQQLSAARVELAGRVRISSVGIVLSSILAPALGVLAARHPRLSLDFSADDRLADIGQRETDIALRLGSTGAGQQADHHVISRRIGALTFRLYAPVMGQITTTILRYHEALDHLPEMQLLSRLRPDATVALRANRLDILVPAALSLGAEVMLPELLGEADQRFVRATGVESQLTLPQNIANRPVYMLVHPERRLNPNVRAVMDWISDLF
jgi:DNA-binding transcriptional LysR family regulator